MKCGCWMYTPGQGADNFKNDTRDGVMGLGMDDIPDLRGLSAEKIAAQMRKQLGGASSYKGVGAYAVKFRDLAVGDIVFVKQGRTKLIGVGRVVGKYRPMPNRKDGFIHTRKVDWLCTHITSRKLFHFGESAFYAVRKENVGELMTVAGLAKEEFPEEAFDRQIHAEDTARSVKCRGGQAQYRAALLRKWRGCCAVTGISEPELLRASHIKPFNVCSLDERYDVNNGFILAAHVDAPFDKGLVTFDDCGRIQFSKMLSKKTIKKMCLSGLRLPRLNPKQKHYLSWHRENVFLG